MIKRKFINVPVIVIGAFVIVYLGLGLMYFQKQVESQNLGSQILLQRAILQKAPPDIAKLNSLYKEAEAGFDHTLTSIAGPGQGVDIYSVLVELDRKSQAEIMSIEDSLPMIITGGKVNGTILPYSLVVRGNQADLMDFISSLIQGGPLLQGLELKSIDIQKGLLPDDPSTLNLMLYIHTWPAAAPGIPEVLPISWVKK